MLAGLSLARIGTAIVSILLMSVQIPIGVILAVGLWLYFDKNSDIRKAVNNATTQLVSGAELEAKNEEIKSLQRINAEKDRRIAGLRTANINFQAEAMEARASQAESEDELEAIRSRPVDPECAVDQHLFDGLRSK